MIFRKKFFLASILLLFSTLFIFPKNQISFFTGINYNEEAYTVIYQTQLAPKFSFGFVNEKTVGYFILSNSISFDFLIWNFYYKNNYLYFTDKTLSVDSPIEYNFRVLFPSYSSVKFIFGAGVSYNTRFDRYSMGKYFWYSRLKIEPLLFGSLGLDFKIYFLIVSLRESLGYLVSTFFLFNKEEFFLYTFTNNLFHRIDLSFIFKINSRIGLVIKWTNKYNWYNDLSIYITNYMSFQNTFSIGLDYEL
ncbi:MAG TPA: hypothetical protein PLO89_01335 [Spirochaetota bacterium]|nr:hypothetical protein [Spirochaetota bacterium]